MTEPRTALVTGSSRGIGAATAVAFAAAGVDVAINYVSNQQAADDIAAQVRMLGRRAEVYQADISKLDECERMADQALHDFGKIDILVNNAGIAETSGAVTAMDPTSVVRLLGYHVLGPIYLCKLLVPQMRQLARGDVVMVSSLVTKLLPPAAASYSIAKTAMEALAHTLAKEERTHGIRVNIVRPGVVDTDMGARFARRWLKLDDIRELDATSPFGFVCQPADVAHAIVFLCSAGGRYITDQCITIDGGGQ